eukprot:CAMPEP_0117557076 /NCGR_PEP_ID=MMETSP0784-20121206/52139_1 /TAXON_ID=39447 /ORGANISM="" /LENGTH=40 /DNA_ID= /DNA_START= /DNA_END= /DNA_ORIENTATION=
MGQRQRDASVKEMPVSATHYWQWPAVGPSLLRVARHFSDL